MRNTRAHPAPVATSVPSSVLLQKPGPGVINAEALGITNVQLVGLTTFRLSLFKAHAARPYKANPLPDYDTAEAAATLARYLVGTSVTNYVELIEIGNDRIAAAGYTAAIVTVAKKYRL